MSIVWQRVGALRTGASAGTVAALAILSDLAICITRFALEAVATRVIALPCTVLICPTRLAGAACTRSAFQKEH